MQPIKHTFFLCSWRKKLTLFPENLSKNYPHYIKLVNPEIYILSVENLNLIILIGDKIIVVALTQRQIKAKLDGFFLRKKAPFYYKAGQGQ